jgi:hypothetical protein
MYNYTILTSTQDGCKWSALLPDHFNSGEIFPSTHWIGGWVDPEASLDVVEEEKIPSLLGIEPMP